MAKLGGIKRVIARGSVMGYRNTSKPLSQIAKELGVDALISGSVLRSGDRVQVTAHLIQASSEQQLWGDRYERQLRDVLSLQNDIVSAITQAIRIQLSPQEKAQLSQARPVNPEAYEAYLKGRFYLNKLTPEGFQKGIAYLQQAVEKDPTNPLPYAGLALGYSLIGHEAMPDAFARAKAAALKAKELGGELAETEEALAENALYSEWDYEHAAQGFKRAMALNPNLPEAHVHYSWYLAMFGRRDDAYAEMKRAIELDPLTPLWPTWLAWQYWDAGRYDDAIAEVKKALELDPNLPWALYVLGAVQAQKGMHAEAIATHQKAAAASTTLRWALGRTYALAGRKEEARKIAAELARNPTPMDCWGLTEIYAALGEKDEAFRWLEEAYRTRFSWMPGIKSFFNQTLDPLRSDPRFADMVRRVNAP